MAETDATHLQNLKSERPVSLRGNDKPTKPAKISTTHQRNLKNGRSASPRGKKKAKKTSPKISAARQRNLINEPSASPRGKKKPKKTSPKISAARQRNLKSERPASPRGKKESKKPSETAATAAMHQRNLKSEASASIRCKSASTKPAEKAVTHRHNPKSEPSSSPRGKTKLKKLASNPAPVDEPVVEVHQAIRAIFCEHAPDKLQNLPALLAKFRGQEASLLTKIQEKYKVAKASFKTSSKGHKNQLKSASGNSKPPKKKVAKARAPKKVPKIIGKSVVKRRKSKKSVASGVSKSRTKSGMKTGKAKQTRDASKICNKVKKLAAKDRASSTPSIQQSRTKTESPQNASTGSVCAGPHVESSATCETLPQAEQDIRAIFKTHAPEKLPNLSKLMLKFRGREQVLLSKIKEKYGLS